MKIGYEKLLNIQEKVVKEFNINRYVFLVTGSAGFIGKNIVQILNSLNVQTIGIDIKPDFDLSPKKFKNLRADYVMDLEIESELKKIEATIKKDLIVLHLSSPLINRSSSNIEENNSKQLGEANKILEKNAVSINNIFNILGSRITHFIYFSTIDVYGEQNKQPITISERTSPLPNTLYSHVKYEGELICQFNSIKHKIPVNNFRLGQVYGPHEGDTYNRLIPYVIKRFFNKESVEIWANSESTRQYISPIEIISYIFDAIMSNQNDTFAKNIVGKHTKILDIVHECRKIIGSGDYELIAQTTEESYLANVLPTKKFIIQDFDDDTSLQLLRDNLNKQISTHLLKEFTKKHE